MKTPKSAVEVEDEMQTPTFSEVEVVEEPKRNKRKFLSEEFRERGYDGWFSRAFILFYLALSFVMGLLMLYIVASLIWIIGDLARLVVGHSVETILNVWIRYTPINIFGVHAIQLEESVWIILTLIWIWCIPHRSGTATVQRSKVWSMATGVGLVGYFLALSTIPGWFDPSWSETFHDTSPSTNRTFEMTSDPTSGSYNRIYEMIFEPTSGSYNRTYEMIFDHTSGSYNWTCDMTFSILFLLGQIGYYYQIVNVAGWIWNAVGYYFQIIPICLWAWDIKGEPNALLDLLEEFEKRKDAKGYHNFQPRPKTKSILSRSKIICDGELYTDQDRYV